MLLSPKAISVAAAKVTAGDFYQPAHGHVYQAIVRLYAAGHPVDPVTVSNELTRAGLIDTIGGPAALVTFQANVPATSNAGRYATIVREHAQARQLIYLAAEISEAAYQLDDPGPLLERLNLDIASGADLELIDLGQALLDADERGPTILARNDGAHLLYDGAVNAIQSEPTAGKSMLALIACKEILDTGRHVMYLDYEDTPAGITTRLLELGVTIDVIIERFHYPRLDAGQTTGLGDLPKRLNLDVGLVVVDGVAESLTQAGYDENAATDVLAWWATIPRPLAKAGACVILLDHVTKARDTRLRWARGSGAKLGAIDGVAYGLDALEGLSRNQDGRLKLTVAKDRPGHIGRVGTIAAIIEIRPHDHGARLEYDVKHDAGQRWAGPIDCMATVRRYFVDNPAAEVAKSNLHSQIRLAYNTGFRDKTVREAADRLVLDGVLQMRTGTKKNSHYFRLHPDHKDTTDSDSNTEPEELF